MKTKTKKAKISKPQRHGGAKTEPATAAAMNGEMEVKWVLRKEVKPDPNQPRKTFDQEKLQELAESIEAVGIRQPIQVEWVTGLKLLPPDLLSKSWSVEKGPKILKNFDGPCAERNAREWMAGQEGGYYRIVDGERRWRAAELVKVERIPVMVVDTTSPDWEKKKLAIQMVLNQQHENLTALEEATAYAKEIEEGRHTAESLYKTLGISRGSLFGRLVLNRLEPEAREALVAGKISVSVAGLLPAVPKDKLKQAIQRLGGNEYNGPMSFRQAQAHIEDNYARQLKGAPFDTEKLYEWEEGMVKSLAAGVGQAPCMLCAVCPNRSGNMEGSGLKNPNVCTLPACFETKTKAAADLKLAEAKTKGLEVLPAKAAEGVFNSHGDMETRYDSPYVDLNEKCGPLGYGTKRTWRTALGKAVAEGEIKVAVAIDPAGEARELVKEEEAKELLKEAGFKLEPEFGNYTNTADHKRMLRNQRKKKAMEKVAGPASAQVLEKLVGLALDKRLWPLIARSAFHHTSIDAHAFVAKRRGLTKVQTDCREKLEKWFKENGEDATECARMAVDLLFCACWNGGSNYTGGPKWDKDFVEACGWAGVKLEKLEEEMEKEKTVGGAAKEEI